MISDFDDSGSNDDDNGSDGTMKGVGRRRSSSNSELNLDKLRAMPVTDKSEGDADVDFGNDGIAEIESDVEEICSSSSSRSSSSIDNDESSFGDSSSSGSSDDNISEGSRGNKYVAKPLFVVNAAELYFGIDKNNDGQGVLLEVTSREVSIKEVVRTGEGNLEEFEILGPSSELIRRNDKLRSYSSASDCFFRDRLNTVNSNVSEEVGAGAAEEIEEEDVASLGSSFNGDDHNQATDSKSKELVQLRYVQHNFCDAYRRIGVYVDHTVVSCHGNAIKKLIAFFHEPVTLHGEEEVEERRRMGLPDEEEAEKNWDIDVQVTNTQVCLLEQIYNGACRTLVLNADIAYFHRWRGYPDEGTKGPGSVDLMVEVLVRSLFFASRSNLNPSNAISLASPFRLGLDIATSLPYMNDEVKEGIQDAPVIKKTVLFWSSKADFNGKLSELDSLHGDKEKKSPFEMPSFNCGTRNNGNDDDSGTRDDEETHEKSRLIDLSLSLPDIRLVGIIIGTLLMDLKGNPAVNAGDQNNCKSDAPLRGRNRSMSSISSAKSIVSEVSLPSGDDPSGVGGIRMTSSVQKGGKNGVSPKELACASSDIDPPPFAVNVREGSLDNAKVGFEGVPTNTQVLAGLSNMRLAFINNVLGIPLLSTRLTDCSVTLSTVSEEEGTSIYSHLTVQGSYFNHLAHRWDPLIETTTVEVDIGKELNSKKTVVSVNVKRPININLTHALLRLLAHDHLLSDHVTSSSKLLAPYTIKNRCGQRITAIFSSFGNPIEIPLKSNNEGLPLDFRSISGVSSKSSLVEGLGRSSVSSTKRKKIAHQGVQEHKMSVSIVVDDWVFESTNCVPMDMPGVHTIRLQLMAFGEAYLEGRERVGRRSMTGPFGLSSAEIEESDGERKRPGNVATALGRRGSGYGSPDNEEITTNIFSSKGSGSPPVPPLLVADVELQPDGSKRITIRSRVCIKNSTGLPIELKFCHQNRSVGEKAARNIITRRFGSGGRSSLTEKVETLESNDILYVPISMVKPSTSMWIRPNDMSDWAPLTDWLKDLEVQDNVISMSPPEISNQQKSSDMGQISTDKWSFQMTVDKVSWEGELKGAVVGAAEETHAEEWDTYFNDDGAEDDGEEDDFSENGLGSNLKVGAGGGKEKNKGSWFIFGKSAASSSSSSSPSSLVRSNTSDSTASTGTMLVKSKSSLSETDNKPLLLFVLPTTNHGYKLASIKRKGSTIEFLMHTAEGGSQKHKFVKRGQDAYDSLHDDFFSRIPSLMHSTSGSEEGKDATESQVVPLLNLTLLPPIVIHNLLCCPMLYRVSDRQGKIAAEGVIPIGSSLPLFRLDLRKKLYLSIRLLNYRWSAFSKLHTPRCVHPKVPKTCNIELEGRKVKKPVESCAAKFVEMEIPTLRLKSVIQGRHVRVFSRFWIVNHTDLTLQYRESSGAVGIETASFLGNGAAYFTHKSYGALGNTSADVESYGTHVMRAAYGFGPDDYDDTKIEWNDRERFGRRKSAAAASGTNEGSEENDYGGRISLFKKFASATANSSSSAASRRKKEATSNPDKEATEGVRGTAATSEERAGAASTSPSQAASAASTFSSFFSSKQKQRSKKGGGGDVNSAETKKQSLTLDDALGALDRNSFDEFDGKNQSNPVPVRKRTVSVGGEDCASILSSEDSGFGSVDHRTSSELMNKFRKMDRFRDSPTMSDLSERTSQFSHWGGSDREGTDHHRREMQIKRRNLLLNQDAAVALKKKLERRLDRSILEKRKILQKRRVVKGVRVRLPTNHLHSISIPDCQSDDTLHDLFNKACELGGLRWTDGAGNTVGVRDKDYIFAYFSSDSLWIPESAGGVGFMFCGYSPLQMGTQIGELQGTELRLCHKAELYVAWQQLDLYNTNNENLRMTRYIEWGESIILSPPATFGMRFHLCARVLDSEWSSPLDVNGRADVMGGMKSCLTLRQLTMKKRKQNVELVGGSLAPRKVVAASVAEDNAEDFSYNPHALEKLVEEVGFDEDEEFSSDEEWAEEGEEEEKEEQGEANLLKFDSGATTAEQNRTIIYEPRGKDSKKAKRDSRCQYDIGVHCENGKGVYFRTAIITFLPRYMLVNDINLPLEVTQFGCEEDWRMVIPGGTSTGFHWPFKDKRFLMRSRLQGTRFSDASWSWSGEFSIDAIGETCIKVREKFSRSDIFLIRVIIKHVAASIVVIFDKVDEFVPYRIDNETSHRIRFRQVASLDGPGSAGGGFDYMMPRSSLPYSWDRPMCNKVLEVEFQQGSKWVKREYRLDALCEHSRVRLTRSLPNLTDPEFEGFLGREAGGLLDKGKGARAYCVLKGPALYIFRPPNNAAAVKIDRLDLLGVINLGPGIHFSLAKNQGSEERMVGSKRQIRQRAKDCGSWTEKLVAEMQKMAEGVVIGSSGHPVGGNNNPANSSSRLEKGTCTEKEMKRESERIFTIAVLLQRYLKEEGPLKDTDIEDQQGAAGVVVAHSNNIIKDKGSSVEGARNSSKISKRLSASMSHSRRRLKSRDQWASQSEGSLLGRGGRSKYRMSGQDWVDLILNLGICVGRGKSMVIAQALFKKGFLCLSSSREGRKIASSRNSLASNSLQHTPRRLRLDSALMGIGTSRAMSVCLSPARRLGDGSSIRGDVEDIDGGCIRRSVPSHFFGGGFLREMAAGPIGSKRETMGSAMSAVGGDGSTCKRRSSTLVTDFFQDSLSVNYVLVAPNRDEDLDMQGSSAFEIVTNNGNVHKWDCRSSTEMRDWVVALRNAADNAALNVLTVKNCAGTAGEGEGRGEEEEKYGEEESKKVDAPDEAEAGGPTTRQAAKQSAASRTGTLDSGVSGLHRSLYEEVTLDSLRAKTHVKVCVKADGPTKVLELSEEGMTEDRDDAASVVTTDQYVGQNMDGQSGGKPGLLRHNVSTRTLASSLSLKSSGAAVQERTIEDLSKLKLEVVVKFTVGISVIDRARSTSCYRPRELIFFSLKDVNLSVRKSAMSTEMALTVEGLQMDNQLHDAVDTCIVKTRKNLNRSKLQALSQIDGGGGGTNTKDKEPGRGEEEMLNIPGLKPRPVSKPPALHIFASRDFVDSKSVIYWDMITVWLHPLDVHVEERMLFQALKLKDAVHVKTVHGAKVLALSNKHAGLSEGEVRHAAFLTSYHDSLRGGSTHLVRGRLISESEVGREVRKKKVFVNLLHVHPIDMALSFKSGGIVDKKKQLGGEAAALAMSAVSGGLDDTRLKLGGLQIANAFGSKTELLDRIVRHYIFACVKQVGGVLGSVEFLGNPIGLVSNLGTGVRDFFYEPLDGLRGGGCNKTFLDGLKRGTTSLGSNFGEGTFNTMSKMTGSLSEGLSHISFDDDYQQKRGVERVKEAKTIGQGLKKGIFEFGESISDAVGGVVMQPIRGMEKEGGVGLMKGIAKGVVGVPVKTVVGILDLTSRATEGIKNEAKSMRDGLDDGEDGKGNGRVRNPRSFGKAGELTEYNLKLARRQKALAGICGGKYADEHVRLHWVVKTLQAPRERMKTLLSGPDLEDVIEESLQSRASEAVVGVGHDNDTSGVVGEFDSEETNGFANSVLDRSVLLSHKRLLYLRGEDGGGGRRGQPKKKPDLIWHVPAGTVETLRIEKNGVRVFLSKSVHFFHGGNEKRLEEASQDLVPMVYDMDCQEDLIFSKLCEENLGREIGELQNLYPTERCVIMHATWRAWKNMFWFPSDGQAHQTNAGV